MTHPQIPRTFGDAFEARPDDTYDLLRAAGPVAWAEIAPGVHALVITSYHAAVEVLTDDTGTYSRDSRRWAALKAGQVPLNSPVLGILGWRPSALYADGAEHERLRGPLEDCNARINLRQLRASTKRHAQQLLEKVAPTGQAELMRDYADVLPMLVFAELLGCSKDLTERMVRACQGIVAADESSAQGAADFAACLAQLVMEKQQEPGRDFASWMISHPAGLNVEELICELYCYVGAGLVPTTAWIASALRLLLADAAYAGTLTGGTTTIRRALEQVLWTKSPLGTFSFQFATRATNLMGTPIPPDTPIMVSHAACNQDPALAHLGYESRAHLAWSAGEHKCPADSQAAVIAETAIEVVLEKLWDVALVDRADAPNRPGLFHQCPAELRVTFRPRPTDPYARPLAPAGGLA